MEEFWNITLLTGTCEKSIFVGVLKLPYTLVTQRIVFFLFLMLVTSGLSAQFGTQGPTTRAVIIGISDYQDPHIQDLAYAHRDAEAFAGYLLQVYPGGIKPENLQLITNEHATGGKVHRALNQILEESKKNDRIFIYFSGHGDVETINEDDSGHLLLYDTPASIYQINSLRLSDLKKIVTELSVNLGAEVILITDACRSGSLAGSGIQGAQVTLNALSQQFGNETKILSCQPDEYSLESAQWGGGRGLFSFHLVEGLTGLADNNDDFQVSLREIQRYLEDQVERDAAPKSQSPMVIGSKNKILTLVDEKQLLDLVKKKTTESNPDRELMSSIFSKSVSPEHSAFDTYRDQFYLALQNKKLLENDIDLQSGEKADVSASELFNLLSSSGVSEIQLRGLKGDFIAALQDDAQSAINAYLRSDNDEMRERELNLGKKYEKFPKYLEKAAELLGPNHYLYNQLLARQHYFQGVNYRIKTIPDLNKIYYNQAKESIEKSLIYEDRAAYIYNELGLIYSKLNENDPRIIEMYKEAIKLSPQWAIPHANMAYRLLVAKNYSEAEKYARQAIALEGRYEKANWTLSKIYLQTEGPESAESILLDYIKRNGPDYYIFNALGELYLSQNDLENALESFKKSNALVPNYSSLMYMGLIYNWQSKNELAYDSWSKALDHYQYDSAPMNNLGWLHQIKNEYDKALKYYNWAIALDPRILNPQLNVAKIYFDQGKLDLSKEKLELIIGTIDQDNADAFYYLARISSVKNDTAKALDYLSKAVGKGFDDTEHLKSDEYLKNIRDSSRFKEIISSIKTN